MTERDAFGNPIEESRLTPRPLTDGDPLRAPAGEPAVSAGPQAAPAGVPTEPAMPASGEPASAQEAATPAFQAFDAPATTVRRRRRLLGCGGLIGLLLFLTPLLVGGWFAYRAFDSTVSPAIDVFDDVRDAVREQAKTATDAARDSASAPPPRGLQRGSLLRPAAFSGILRKARANPGGKLLLLRLDPARADLQLSRRGGGMRMVQLRWDGGRTLLVSSSAGGRGRPSIAFAKIDTGAPSRLVRAAARRLGRKTTSIDYLVLIDILDGPRWSAYFKGGAAFQGDAHGKIVRRIQ